MKESAPSRMMAIAKTAMSDRMPKALKGVENRDTSDCDEAQHFDRYIACGFGLHVFLSSLGAP